MIKNTFAFLIIVFLSLASIGCGNDVKVQEPEAGEPTVVHPPVELEPEESIGIVNSLTGEKAEIFQKLTAVMIDNLGPARPQSGLSRADVIYEIEAEGLITRLMALFYGDPPEFAGPVRSARPYYMQIAKEWDAYYVHVGGCNDSFAKAKQWQIRDIDDTKGHKGFYLDSTRSRPHSTYIDFAKALETKGDNGKLKDWNFIEQPADAPKYKEIALSYSKSNNILYKWDASKKAYLRFINNQPHTDRESTKQLSANNILIQYANHRSLNTQLKHIWVDVVGKGEAEYFLGGQYQRGSWEKESMDSPTLFYDENGNHINFIKGKTWIQVIRPSVEINKA